MTLHALATLGILAAAVAALALNRWRPDVIAVGVLLLLALTGVVSAEEAVETARSYTTRPAAVLGIIRRVIITDGGDNTCFEWKNGEGVTYPPREDAA